jgi:hypothetical protein
MRARKHAQRGAALLSFAVFLGVIILGIITTLSAGLLRKQQGTLLLRQQAYVEEVIQRVGIYYEKNAGVLDRDSTWTSYRENSFKAAAIDQEKFGVTLVVSDRLTSPEGIKYRRVLVYTPSDTDALNPPDTASFATSGVFNTCSDPSKACDRRAFAIYDALDLQKRNYARTVVKMQEIALRAQTYYKARVLQDPERNSTVNYFLPPLGCSAVLANDLPCLPLTGNGFVDLASANISGQLGLEPSLFTNAWGTAIQVTNMAPHAETTAAPYSLVIRTQSPWGGFMQIYATQTL